MLGTQFGQILLAVLGVLVTAGEYASGMIRASLTTVPRRLPVLWAKAAVFGAVARAVMFATVFLTFPLAQLFLSDTDMAAGLGDPGVVRALCGAAVGIALLGLLCLGLGALLRSIPAAIGAYIGAVLVLPEVVGLLPYDVVDDVVACLPSKVAQALMLVDGALTCWRWARPCSPCAARSRRRWRWRRCSSGAGTCERLAWAARGAGAWRRACAYPRSGPRARAVRGWCRVGAAYGRARPAPRRPT